MSPKPSPDAFVSLYTRYQPQLYRFVATLVPHRQDADDVLQETARVLWQKFATYDPAQPFLPWAYAIARFEVLNHRQRAATQQRYFSDAVVDQLAGVREQYEELLSAQATALQGCLEKLPPPDRQLIQQRYLADDTLTDLARKLGRMRNSFYKSLQRIRAVLFQCVHGQLRAEGWL